MKVYVLASGSKGNSTLIDTGETRVLIDHGISTKQLCERLRKINIAPDSIDAIIITHEHDDHVKGIPVWRKKFATTIYSNLQTARALKNREILNRENGGVKTFETGSKFEIGDICFHAFPVSHDAAETVGLVFECGGRRVGIATDMGHATELVRRRLSGLDAMIIESNHDVDMLINGPYPWPIKDRIRKNYGHMSNHQTADLLRVVAHSDLQAVLLAHLSQENNRPALALDCAHEAINGYSHTKIILGRQDRIADPLILD